MIRSFTRTILPSRSAVMMPSGAVSKIDRNCSFAWERTVSTCHRCFWIVSNKTTMRIPKLRLMITIITQMGENREYICALNRAGRRARRTTTVRNNQRRVFSCFLKRASTVLKSHPISDLSGVPPKLMKQSSCQTSSTEGGRSLSTRTARFALDKNFLERDRLTRWSQ